MAVHCAYSGVPAWLIRVCTSKPLPSLSAFSVLSLILLFLYYLQSRSPAVHTCACSFQNGKEPMPTSFPHPSISLSPSITLSIVTQNLPQSHVHLAPQNTTFFGNGVLQLVKDWDETTLVNEGSKPTDLCLSLHICVFLCWEKVGHKTVWNQAKMGYSTTGSGGGKGSLRIEASRTKR